MVLTESEKAMTQRLVRVRDRGVPSRRKWEAPSPIEVDILRMLATSNGLRVTELVRVLSIHRTRLRLERAR